MQAVSIARLEIVVLCALLGAACGSFAAVIARRRGSPRSPLRGRSVCERCGLTLRWFDTLPVMSYAILRGRCRDCGAPIPCALVVCELAGAVLGALAALVVTGSA